MAVDSAAAGIEPAIFLLPPNRYATETHAVHMEYKLTILLLTCIVQFAVFVCDRCAAVRGDSKPTFFERVEFSERESARTADWIRRELEHRRATN